MAALLGSLLGMTMRHVLLIGSLSLELARLHLGVVFALWLAPIRHGLAFRSIFLVLGTLRIGSIFVFTVLVHNNIVCDVVNIVGAVTASSVMSPLLLHVDPVAT